MSETRNVSAINFCVCIKFFFQFLNKWEIPELYKLLSYDVTLSIMSGAWHFHHPTLRFSITAGWKFKIHQAQIEHVIVCCRLLFSVFFFSLQLGEKLRLINCSSSRGASKYFWEQKRNIVDINQQKFALLCSLRSRTIQTKTYKLLPNEKMRLTKSFDHKMFSFKMGLRVETIAGALMAWKNVHKTVCFMAWKFN